MCWRQWSLASLAHTTPSHLGQRLLASRRLLGLGIDKADKLYHILRCKMLIAIYLFALQSPLSLSALSVLWTC